MGKKIGSYMGQNALGQSDCRIFKLTISLKHDICISVENDGKS